MFEQVNVGAGVTEVVPIWQHSVFEPAMKRYDMHSRSVALNILHRWDFGGHDIDDLLFKCLVHNGVSLPDPSHRHGIIADIKKALAYVPLEYEPEWRLSQVSSQLIKIYQLPDGQALSLPWLTLFVLAYGLHCSALKCIQNALNACNIYSSHGDSRLSSNRRRVLACLR